MATSTVLRVKRRLEENPQDALVLMCKRIKTDSEEISPSLFVFRGTVDSQETTQVKNVLPKIDIKQQKINAAEIIKKMRAERKEVTTENRYKLLNCSRGVKEDSNEDSNVYNFIDLQKTDDKEGDVIYAYDLYTSYKKEFDVTMIDNIVSVETEILLDSYQDPFSSDCECDDDDDSNDENNWRNEYPDSEQSSIELEDMINAMANVDMEELSSDEGEEDIYDDNCVRKEDVENYGAAYAKYKAKVLAENPDLKGSKLVHSSRDDSYKDDSDGFYYGEDEDTEQFKDQYFVDSDASGRNSPI